MPRSNKKIIKTAIHQCTNCGKDALFNEPEKLNKQRITYVCDSCIDIRAEKLRDSREPTNRGKYARKTRNINDEG